MGFNLQQSPSNALNDHQLVEIKAAAVQLPAHLRGRYLERLTELLPPNPGDGDVWRTAQRVRQEILSEVASPA